MAHSGVLTLSPRYHSSPYLARQLHTREFAEHLSACPACGSARLRPITTIETEAGELALERSYCEDCTLVTFTRRPDGDWYTRFYESAWDPVGSKAVPKPANYDAIASVLLPFLPDKNARILEIGCGYGVALETMRKRGYQQLYGIEASRKRADYARERGFKVALCTAEELLTDPVVASGAPYDAVYSWHVFEHLHDPGRAVENIAQLLAPGGVAFVCVPHVDAEHLFFMAHYVPHIHSFSERSLATLFERRGFRIEHSDNSLRIVARKQAGAAPAQDAVPKDRFARLLGQKFVRDFGLRAIPPGYRGEVAFHYSLYRGGREILEPSYGKVTPLAASAPKITRALGAVKKRLLGLEGRDHRPKLVRELGRRTFGRSINDVVARLELDADASSFAPVERLRVVYPGDSVVVYVK